MRILRSGLCLCTVAAVAAGSSQPSSSVRLARADGQVMVRTQTGSKIKRWVGFGLAMGGVGSAAVGGLYLLAGSSTNTDTFGNTTTSDAYKVVGITYLVVGAVLMAIGFPMWAAQSTSVDVR